MAEVRRQAGTASIMEEKDQQESLFVTKVKQVWSRVEELKPLDKRIWSAKGGDEITHVMGSKESVEPAAALVGLS